MKSGGSSKYYSIEPNELETPYFAGKGRGDAGDFQIEIPLMCEQSDLILFRMRI